MNDIEYLKKYLEPSKYQEGLRKLEQGIPVQYIVGNVNFYGYKINVNKNVLIPRFETEELVFKTINYINKYFDKKVSILDIGTGSGCIAITLKKELNCDVDAVDISNKALEVAKKNAEENNVKINFFESNVFSNVKNKYDIIVSNPPYISYDEQIMDIVKNNEPNQALYADNEGLYFYEKILEESKKYLNKKFIIAFEIGYLQGNKIKELSLLNFPNCEVRIEKDMQEKDRFVFIMSK